LQYAFQQSSARDTYNFSSCENGAFLLVEATVCCWFYHWSEISHSNKIVAHSDYTSTIEQSLLKWNGHDCDGLMHVHNWVLLLSCDYVLKFDWYCQLSGRGSTAWTCGSCQAVSPMAWEQGLSICKFWHKFGSMYHSCQFQWPQQFAFLHCDVEKHAILFLSTVIWICTFSVL